MHGEISTYLAVKGYGFIKGNDGNDYFFHDTDFSSSKDKICHGAPVVFDPSANAKGYRASDCKLLDTSDIDTYLVPEKFVVSKYSDVKGWEILEDGEWWITGTSSDSPDGAKDDLIVAAEALGANAVVDARYSKSTGSNGNYDYTIHHYRGRMVCVGKKSTKGYHSLSEIVGVNEAASELKNQLIKKSKTGRDKRFFWLALLFITTVIAGLGVHFVVGIPFLVLALFLKYSIKVDYDSWLEPAS